MSNDKLILCTKRGALELSLSTIGKLLLVIVGALIILGLIFDWGNILGSLTSNLWRILLGR